MISTYMNYHKQNSPFHKINANQLLLNTYLNTNRDHCKTNQNAIISYKKALSFSDFLCSTQAHIIVPHATAKQAKKASSLKRKLVTDCYKTSMSFHIIKSHRGNKKYRKSNLSSLSERVALTDLPLSLVKLKSDMNNFVTSHTLKERQLCQQIIELQSELKKAHHKLHQYQHLV
jgi:hypothetical protein